MPDFNENFTSWTPPQDGGPPSPLQPGDKLWLFCKVGLVLLAEAGNWALHTANYALVNPVGSDLFLIDVLGLPELPGLSNITLGILLNGVLGLAAVATPVFLFSQLLERREEIFGGHGFFNDGVNFMITILLCLLYVLVIASEFSALYMRIQEEVAPSLIPSMDSEAASFWPMMIMSIALIITNAAMGLACAHILRSTKRALKGG